MAYVKPKLPPVIPTPSTTPTMTTTPNVGVKMPSFGSPVGTGVGGGGGGSFGGSQVTTASSLVKPTVPPVSVAPAVAPKLTTQQQDYAYRAPALPPAVPPVAPTPSTVPDTTTPTTPTTPPATGDVYNFEAYIDEQGNQKFKRRGEPTPVAPTVAIPPATDILKTAGIDTQSIEDNLARTKAAIEQKYALLKKQAEEKTFNERQSNLSGLYSAGEVDPRSSSVMAVDSLANRALNERNAALEAQKNAELSDAENTAYNRKTTAAENARTLQLDAEKRVQQKYENERAAFQDNIAKINNVIAQTKNKAEITNQERDDARTALVASLTAFGSSALDGKTDEELAQLEKATGVVGLVKGVKTLKQQEVLGKANNIKELKNADGSTTWVNLTQDKNGEWKTTTIAQGKAKPGGETGGIYSQLDYRTANAILAKADKFGTSDIVKKYNNFISASNLIAAVDPNTQNPAEHQAIVYNFAKALDPDSVVREGEYATVKKYSQSLIDRYGGEIKQAIKGSGFLSPQAIKAIQEATDNRIKAYEPQYKNLKDETTRVINTMAGKDIADQILLDYETGYVGNQPQQASQEDYQHLIDNGATPQEAAEYLGFTNEGSVSSNAHIKKVAEAIGKFESGGNYQAIGNPTSTGDKAYGKYQVMGANIPSWTKEVFGRPMTVEQFLRNPAAQDIVAHAKMTSIYNKYGNPADVASVWFSGQPLAKAGNRKDVNGTTVPQYVQNILANLA